VRRALVAGLLAGTLGCHSGPGIRAGAEVVQADIDRARRSNAVRCAPRELAQAEANLDFVSGELAEGNSARAYEHLTAAETAARQAVTLSRDCAPRQVVVKEEPKLVLKIEENDADGDGVPDPQDRCPTVAGPASNQGCPLDRDGDGIPDDVDQCPDQKEDLDGFQDEDGCPDPDNDGDGILDTADRCPNMAGPMTNLGCPVLDQDGDGVPDDQDACPDRPGPASNKGCPVLDRDGDGVPDDKDRCPDEPEDRDGFQDEDGCPDLDNDNDGVPDDKDLCPNEPGPAETGGCPRKFSLITVTRERIEIRKQIRFATGSAKIVGAESEKVLDEVALALADNRQIKKLRIEGHTDSVGDDAVNLKLSQHRASAVLSALLRRRVDPGRLEAVGFGETRPIASNRTAAGRAENRRTEFNILEQ
jgi:OmpA-OmpF porin, OOP family